tara:strand:+ start:682 stop:1098 length:417 start_codon:yes stop_codon:yes gene_type:complete
MVLPPLPNEIIFRIIKEADGGRYTHGEALSWVMVDIKRMKKRSIDSDFWCKSATYGQQYGSGAEDLFTSKPQFVRELKFPHDAALKPTYMNYSVINHQNKEETYDRDEDEDYWYREGGGFKDSQADAYWSEPFPTWEQ